MIRLASSIDTYARRVDRVPCARHLPGRTHLSAAPQPQDPFCRKGGPVA